VFDQRAGTIKPGGVPGFGQIAAAPTAEMPGMLVR
jgi:hypothetical protein